MNRLDTKKFGKPKKWNRYSHERKMVMPEICMSQVMTNMFYIHIQFGVGVVTYGWPSPGFSNPFLKRDEQYVT